MTIYSAEELYRMNKSFTYTGSKLNEISFPLGGIGTGAIGLAGNGRLIDWEIFNRPNKRSYNGFSFFAIRAEREGEIRWGKILNGDLHPQYSGNANLKSRGFGFGVERESMAGLPHYEQTEFTGEFPFGTISYVDSKSPVDVKLTAFNPLIPMNSKDSSLPVAIFTFEVTNRSDEPLNVTLVGNLGNPHDKDAHNEAVSFGPYKGVSLSSTLHKHDDPRYGNLTLSTDGRDVSHQTYWHRGRWFDNMTVFWKDFITPGRFRDRLYTAEQLGTTYKNHREACLLANHQQLNPGESGTFRFIISWHYPNFVNYWNPVADEMPSWKNYYATLFEHSVESAEYAWDNLPRLERESRLFKESLFRTTMPDYVIDAISSNISILKSPTCVRLTDGTLYGFEGIHATEGCCEGSCTHVWNYEQVTPFLFPDLARSMRDIDYQATMQEDGKMTFRLMLPPERSLSDVSQCAGPERAAADGQMGGIVKVYREWKISGDTDWLKSIWPNVKKALEFAWAPTNSDWWDRDADGVMEGVQHHTLDVEIYGPNTYITGLYHAALVAAADMAHALGDPAGERYKQLYEQGKVWVDQNLFNGEYYYQQIDLQDERFQIDPELGEIKYQIGEGCHIDQVIGQWHAHIVGLGYILDQNKVKTSLGSIFKYNFIDCMRDIANACRIYALNDEKGLLICTWPKANSPKVPVPYADECMNGFEYQAACHMIYEGLVEEGLTVVKAIRDRYDGNRRNPWNEFECGSNYARSMASYSLLLALSGFEYDMNRHHIGFNPKLDGKVFSSFWALNRGWGEFGSKGNDLILQVHYGELGLRSFASDQLSGRSIGTVSVGDREVEYSRDGNVVQLGEAVRLSPTASLKITIV